jgi:hypothetical protein
MDTSELHTISKRLTDVRVVVGFVIMVLGTVVSVAFGAINYVVNINNAPIVAKISAMESRDNSMEASLVELKASNLRVESKLDRVLFKFVPSTISSSGETLVIKK